MSLKIKIWPKQLKSMSFSKKWPKMMLRDFSITYLNPFNTLRFGKIRLFERPNRGMLIRATRCHEFTSQEQVLKNGSAGATLGFQWH